MTTNNTNHETPMKKTKNTRPRSKVEKKTPVRRVKKTRLNLAFHGDVAEVLNFIVRKWKFDSRHKAIAAALLHYKATKK